MALFQEAWQSLATLLDRATNDQSVSPEAYQSCFNNIQRYLKSEEYNQRFFSACVIFCAAEKRRTDEENRVAEAETKRTGRTVQPVRSDPNENNEANIPGSELYVEIKTYLQKYIDRLSANEQNLQGESYFRAYGKMWQKFLLITKLINGLCPNLNTNWIRRQRSEGRRYIHETGILAMNFWNQVFFERSTAVLTKNCLDMIEKDRKGEQIDKSLLKNVIDSYVSVGSSIQGNNAGASANLLRLYQEHFETHFLRATEEYYKNLTSRSQLIGNTKSYIEKISTFIQEEEDRIVQYLHSSTREALLALIKAHLILVQLKEIQDAAIEWISNADVQSLKAAFGLLKRIDNGNDPVAHAFGEHILSAGTRAINDCAQRALNDPQLYVETILGIYQRFREILQDAFSEIVNRELKPDRKYSTSLDKAFGQLVNTNAVIELARQEKKSAELIARYCDLILRRGEKVTNGVPVPEKLGQIMIVFNYINDKDAFQSFYIKLLAKRLVTESSASDDDEEFMIREFKSACGNEYTTKIQRMFQDIITSRDFEEEFRNALITTGDQSFGKFSLMILSGNSWPLTPVDPFTLPKELIDRIDICTGFYLQKNNARKLLWLHQHSKCDLEIKFGKKAYIFTTSVLQATILFLFNKSTSLSIQEVQEKTQLLPPMLRALLLGLIQSNVFQCLDIADTRNLNSLEESDLQPEHKIQLSSTFRNERTRVNLIRPIKMVEQQETKTTNEQVDKDRHMHTELVIVRVMKARQTLSHADLIRETTQQLLVRFRPEVPKIKRCIAGLIEKEYLRRDENNREVYHYVA